MAPDRRLWWRRWVSCCDPEQGIEPNQEHQKRHGDTGSQGGIHPVKNTAMARDHGAGILDAEAALDEAFKQIAGMSGDAEQKSEQPRLPDRAAQEPDESRKN